MASCLLVGTAPHACLYMCRWVTRSSSARLGARTICLGSVSFFWKPDGKTIFRLHSNIIISSPMLTGWLSRAVLSPGAIPDLSHSYSMYVRAWPYTLLKEGFRDVWRIWLGLENPCLLKCRETSWCPALSCLHFRNVQAQLSATETTFMWWELDICSQAPPVLLLKKSFKAKHEGSKHVLAGLVVPYFFSLRFFFWSFAYHVG